MDELRKIRILFPPLVLIASVAFGDYLDTNHSLISSGGDWQHLITKGAVVLLAGGYLIGSITEAFYSVIFRRKILQKHFVSDTAYKQIIILLGFINEEEIKDKLYPVAVFDHAYINEKVHQWIQRRWQTCYTSFNCFIALLLALVFGYIDPITINYKWIIFTIVFSITLLTHAQYAWKEVVNMIEFEADRMSEED